MAHEKDGQGDGRHAHGQERRGSAEDLREAADIDRDPRGISLEGWRVVKLGGWCGWLSRRRHT